MRIDGVRLLNRNRYKVDLSDGRSFILYRGEMETYNIREDGALSDETYKEIVARVLKPRARKRAMGILERAARTTRELTEKLERDGYPKECVSDAIAYVERFGYLNDERYMETFIRNRASKKSRRELFCLLRQKGFSEEQAEHKLEEMADEADDRAAIASILKKKGFDPAHADPRQREKLAQSLMRKGFRYRDICQVIQMSCEDA